MSWVAEILRKQHRACSRCRLGPTHLYDPAPLADDDPPAAESGMQGTPLCNACLETALAHDLSRFEARCLVFEPALGPEALAFHPLEGAAARSWPAGHLDAARAGLGRIEPQCRACGTAGRFLWVPVEQDANLWAADWLACLGDGTLAAGDTLCGRCTARRLVKTFDDRGLFFEAIVPPRGGDGVLFCSESY